MDISSLQRKERERDVSVAILEVSSMRHFSLDRSPQQAFDSGLKPDELERSVFTTLEELDIESVTQVPRVHGAEARGEPPEAACYSLCGKTKFMGFTPVWRFLVADDDKVEWRDKSLSRLCSV